MAPWSLASTTRLSAGAVRASLPRASTACPVRSSHSHFVKATLGRAQPGHPLPFKVAAMVFKQHIGADNGRFHGLEFKAKGAVVQRTEPRLGGDRSHRRALPLTQQCMQLIRLLGGFNALAQCRIAEHFSDLGQYFQVFLRRRFGHEQENE